MDTDDIDSIVIDYMLEFHYSGLSEMDKKLCQTILDITVGNGALCHAMVARLKEDSPELFPTTQSVVSVIEKLASKGVIEWKVLINRASSLPYWEHLDLKPRWVEEHIFAAACYGFVIHDEINNIDNLDSHYYQDSTWLDVLCPPKII